VGKLSRASTATKVLAQTDAGGHTPEVASAMAPRPNRPRTGCGPGPKWRGRTERLETVLALAARDAAGRAAERAERGKPHLESDRKSRDASPETPGRTDRHAERSQPRFESLRPVRNEQKESSKRASSARLGAMSPTTGSASGRSSMTATPASSSCVSAGSSLQATEGSRTPPPSPPCSPVPEAVVAKQLTPEEATPQSLPTAARGATEAPPLPESLSPTEATIAVRHGVGPGPKKSIEVLDGGSSKASSRPTVSPPTAARTSLRKELTGASNGEEGEDKQGQDSVLVRSIPRIPELPRLHEERSLECTFQVAFLVPFGPEGRNFLDNIRSAFLEAPSPVNGSHAAAAASSDRSFVLVPYAGSRTALVLLQEVGPVQALEHVRLRSQSQTSQSTDSGRSLKVSAESLPEPTNEMCARSTALVYVVHSAQSMDDRERQLGPICAVEAFYAATTTEFLPSRSIAALREGAGMSEAPSGLPGTSSPAPTTQSQKKIGAGASDTVDILRQLQQRRVGELPCTEVFMEDRASHRSLLINLVTSLAGDFCLSARQSSDIHEPKKVVDFADTDTGTPVTNLSRSSSAKTTPDSSMLMAAHESPGTSANAVPASLATGTQRFLAALASLTA